MSATSYTQVDTSPTKRFFVEMLTRDIAVEDAILDLLDNCVDGILRSNPESRDNKDDPYEGFWAKIFVNGDRFEIDDNCGGIPWAEHERAFRMGRATEDGGEPLPEGPKVGSYGIGMKRAIFKMGSRIIITTQNGDDRYEVLIDNDWMHNEGEWKLDVEPAEKQFKHDGTNILVEELHPGVHGRFASKAFEEDLIKRIEGHYAVIIGKGFHVEVNGKVVRAKPVLLRFAPPESGDVSVRPYMFRGEEDGVKVFVTVGLRDPVPNAEEVLDGQAENLTGSDFAGWTIICNDRVVLYCNKDELTGWGTANIPRYHTQFISISGVVEFTGDPRKLPTTTTKRGLDYSSKLYQQVLNRMRGGLRMFIDFTNDWKAREDEARLQVVPTQTLTYSALREKAASQTVTFHTVQQGIKGEQFKPQLPRPPRESSVARIAYTRDKDDVQALAEELLDDARSLKDKDRRRMIGEFTFDRAFEERFGGKATND